MPLFIVRTQHQKECLEFGEPLEMLLASALRKIKGKGCEPMSKLQALHALQVSNGSPAMFALTCLTVDNI